MVEFHEAPDKAIEAEEAKEACSLSGTSSIWEFSKNLNFLTPPPPSLPHSYTLLLLRQEKNIFHRKKCSTVIKLFKKK